MNLEDLKKPVADWFQLFLEGTADAMHPKQPLLQSLVNRGVLNYNGKHLRPLLALLIAKAFGRTDIDNVISSAVSVELVHIASLIHDDILDEAECRHGVPTPNSVVGPHAAVLGGDYVLSRGVYYSVSKGNIRAVDLLVETMEKLVEGELLQKSYSETLDIDKEGYFKVISMKTSCLIGVAARLAAPKEYDSQMSLIGSYLGAAFQIKDDMLDIWSTKTGKDRYNDFKEKKITLPLIYAMDDDPQTRSRVKELLSGDVSEEVAETLAEIVTSSQALAKLEATLDELRTKAVAIIDMLPDSEARSVLYGLAEFMTGRNY